MGGAFGSCVSNRYADARALSRRHAVFINLYRLFPRHFAAALALFYRQPPPPFT